MADPALVAEHVAAVRSRIEQAARVSGRAASDVHLLAAVKYADTATCAALLRAGVGDLAENRLDGLLRRQHELSREADPDLPAPVWHFIGRLQSRQAAAVAERVAAIHTLHSPRAAARLVGAAHPPMLLVQVNIARDPAKDGLAPEQVEPFLAELPEPLQVSGLMTMPPLAERPEHSRRAFCELRELRDALLSRCAGRHPLHALSMGTSQDFAVAVEEGATHVRLGRVLYDPMEASR